MLHCSFSFSFLKHLFSACALLSMAVGDVLLNATAEKFRFSRRRTIHHHDLFVFPDPIYSHCCVNGDDVRAERLEIELYRAPRHASRESDSDTHVAANAHIVRQGFLSSRSLFCIFYTSHFKGHERIKERGETTSQPVEQAAEYLVVKRPNEMQNIRR